VKKKFVMERILFAIMTISKESRPWLWKMC